MKFGEFRKYVSRIDRVSICRLETSEYRNYQFISNVRSEYDELYLFGVGRIQSEFPLCMCYDVAVQKYGEMPEDKLEEMVYAECIEIMLSDKPREFNDATT